MLNLIHWFYFQWLSCVSSDHRQTAHVNMKTKISLQYPSLLNGRPWWGQDICLWSDGWNGRLMWPVEMCVCVCVYVWECMCVHVHVYFDLKINILTQVQPPQVLRMKVFSTFSHCEYCSSHFFSNQLVAIL